jgi:TPP-dependent trihydroxycyclohexane-1,2-dione (THcHDO) dehydratase
MTIAFDYDTRAELFDYDTPAELYSNKGRRLRRQPLEYRQFARAADAIRFAIEEMPPQLLQSAYLEVDEERFDSQAIRRLYESADYPLARLAEGSPP